MPNTATATNVLFVDDEQFILRSLQRLFAPLYNVFTASSGKEAIEVVRQNEIHVVVCDQRMPEMIGVEALAKIKEISPATMRILLTGYSDMSALVNSINDSEIFRYILKPWNNKELKEVVRYAADIAHDSLEEGRGGTQFFAPQDPVSALHPVTDQNTAPLFKPNPQSKANLIAEAPPVDILVVDDDKAIFSLVNKSYDNKGLVHYANSIDKAFGLLETYNNIGILITDVKVSQESVVEMVSALKLHYPFIVTIVLTSLNDTDMLKRLINQCQVFRFMIKPPSPTVLMGSIQMAMDKHGVLKTTTTEVNRYQVDVKELNVDSAIFKRMSSLGSRLKAKLRSLLGW